MISVELKLRLNKAQEAKLEQWLWHLTGVYNWAIRKIELDAKDGIYCSEYKFKNLLAFHSKKIGVGGITIQETLGTAYSAWKRCFKKLSRRPRFKGKRNKLNSIPFGTYIRIIDESHINVMGFDNRIRFHKQRIPGGVIKNGRIIKRASGWYLSLNIGAKPSPIPILGHGVIGIDPGFKTTITTSSGDKLEQPKEFSLSCKRLAQAQRGNKKQLVSRIQERIKNRRRDNNHKLSRRLVSQNKFIAFSKDSIRGLKNKFGKSVTDAGIYELRSMLSYKSSHCGRKYIEVPSRKSTMTCSNCGVESGPTGWSKLAVRFWECSACGAQHDRDVNAAINTLKAGLGMSLGTGTVNTEFMAGQ